MKHETEYGKMREPGAEEEVRDRRGKANGNGREEIFTEENVGLCK